MTAGEFIKKVEDYYGKYPRSFQKQATLAYCRRHQPGLDRIYEELLLTKTGSGYNPTPDIAPLETIRRKVVSEMGIFVPNPLVAAEDLEPQFADMISGLIKKVGGKSMLDVEVDADE